MENFYMPDDGEQEVFNKKKQMMGDLAGISDAINSGHSIGEFYLGNVVDHKPIQPGILKSFEDKDPMEKAKKQNDLLAKYQEMKNQDARMGLERSRFAYEKQKDEADRKNKLEMLLKEYQLKKELEGAKKQADMGKLTVPGYSLSGEVTPADDEAKKLREAKAAMDTLNSQLEEYAGLVNKNGNFEAFGNDAARMGSLATDMQLKLKSPDAYNLGVLSGPDLDLLRKQIEDPASFGAMFTRKKSALSGLSQLKESMNKKYDDKMKASGYVKKVMTQDDKAALDWARKNPEDSRSAEILRRLGVQ